VDARVFVLPSMTLLYLGPQPSYQKMGKLVVYQILISLNVDVLLT